MKGGAEQMPFRPFRIAVTIAWTLVLPALFAPIASHEGRGARIAASLRPHTVPVGRDPVALAVDERTSRVFVVGSAGGVTLLDATTGVVLRSVAVGRGAQAVAVDEATGRVFVTDPGRVFLLDARTGAVLHAFPVGGGGPSGGLVLDARHGEVFVAVRGVDHGPAGSGPGSIVVLDAATGQTRRTIHATTDLLVVDSVARRLIVPQQCGGDASTANACADTLDAVTGQRLKTVDFGGQEGFTQQPSAVAVDARAGRAFVLYGDGRGVSDVGTLATRTGVGQGTVGGAAGSLGTIAVDEQAGRIVIATAPDSYAAASGAGPPRTAFVSVLDTRSGRDLANTTVPTASQAYVFVPGTAADPRRGRFYVAATLYPTATATLPRSILDVFAASSGRLVRTLTLPMTVGQPNAPVGPAMAVDGRSDRLFIANAGANTVIILDTTRL